MKKQSDSIQLILFLAISYGHLWLLFVAARVFDIPFTYDPRRLGGQLVLVGIPASLVAAVVTTLITGSREDLRRLFKRSLAWRFSPAWYLAGAIAPLLVAFASTMAGVWSGGAELPKDWFSPSMPLGFMVFLLLYIGLGEEIGWRGFALPRFQAMWGSLGGSLATGIFWALWHLPLFLMPGSSQYGSSLILFIYLATCWTIPMALLAGKSHGSVIPAILLHGSVNLLAFAIRYPQTYVELFYGVAAIIAAVFLPKPLFAQRKTTDLDLS